MVEAYPLAWPAGVTRTPSHQRERAKFGRMERNVDYGWKNRKGLTVAQASTRLLAELDRLGATHEVVSTNVELRLDGLPYSNRKNPTDPGVAVYFMLEGAQHCMPCDRWDRVEDNLAAVAKHVESIRGQLRWGVGDVRAAFAGFRALPGKGETGNGAGAWWTVLGVAHDSPLDQVKAAYRKLCVEHHPDRGGDSARMSMINAAWEQAQQMAFLAAEGGR